MALGLNCGFKNKDVTSMQASWLTDGRLIGMRSKTKVPMNYKLWPVTRELIERCRDDRNRSIEGRVFANRNGGEISSNGITKQFKDLSTRLEVLHSQAAVTKTGEPRYATFEQLRDTSVDLVEHYLMGQGYDQALKQVFLAHKDSTTAAYYTSNDPRRMNTSLLDKVVDHLESVYALPALEHATA